MFITPIPPTIRPTEEITTIAIAAIAVIDLKLSRRLSDVVMPTMDGPTTVRAARKTHPDLPILFISGYAEEQLRKSIDLENVNFLPKPFSLKQLVEKVKEVMEN